MASDHAMSAFLLLYLGILLPVVVPNADILVHIHVEYTSHFNVCIQCQPIKHPNDLASYHLNFTKTNEINDSVVCKNVSEPLHVGCYEHGKDHGIETYVLPTQDHQNVPSTDTIARCYQNGTGEVCWIFHVYDDSAANCNVSGTAPIIGTVTTFLPSLLSDDKFNRSNKSKLLESLELLRTSMFGDVTCARITGTLTYKADISVHIHVEYTSDFKACIKCWTGKHPGELASYHLNFTKTNESYDSVACKDVNEPLHVGCYEHGKDHGIETYVLPTQDHQNVPSTDTIERCYQNGTGEVCWIFHVYDDSAANCNVSSTASIIGTVTTFLPSMLSDDKFNSTNKSELLESLELMRTSMFGNLTCARITGTLTYKGKEPTPTSCVSPVISTARPNVDPIYGMIGDNPTYVTVSFSVLIALAAALLIAICVSCTICFCFCYRHRYKDRYEIQENTDVNHEAFTTM